MSHPCGALPTGVLDFIQRDGLIKNIPVIDQDIDDADNDVVERLWRATDDHFLFLYGYSEIVSNDAFPPGTFYLVAVTYDGATFRLYVNGVLEGPMRKRPRLAIRPPLGRLVPQTLTTGPSDIHGLGME